MLTSRVNAKLLLYIFHTKGTTTEKQANSTSYFHTAVISDSLHSFSKINEVEVYSLVKE